VVASVAILAACYCKYKRNPSKQLIITMTTVRDTFNVHKNEFFIKVKDRNLPAPVIVLESISYDSCS